MDLLSDYQRLLTRRQLFGRSATGLGTAALASLLNPQLFAAEATKQAGVPGMLPMTHLPAKVKRVIYLVMSGGPSHIDLFDYKPKQRWKSQLRKRERKRTRKRQRPKAILKRMS